MKRDISVAELCRREGILLAAYYSWTNDFMEGGKAQLQRDARYHADSSGVEKLKRENATLRDLEIAPSTYYGWKRRMKARGVKAILRAVGVAMFPILLAMKSHYALVSQ